VRVALVDIGGTYVDERGTHVTHTGGKFEACMQLTQEEVLHALNMLRRVCVLPKTYESCSHHIQIPKFCQVVTVA